MARTLLAGYVNPTGPERDADFNSWYDQTHIPQVVERINGVVGARRYRLAQVQLVEDKALPKHRYLSLYEIDADDVQTVALRLASAMTDGSLDMTDALDTTDAPPVLHFYDRIF